MRNGGRVGGGIEEERHRTTGDGAKGDKNNSSTKCKASAESHWGKGVNWPPNFLGKKIKCGIFL